MNAKSALVKALLDGMTVNCSNIWRLTSYTNCSREIIRQIEDPKTGFGVIVSRLPREDKNRWGVHCSWIDYRLNRSIEENKQGVIKMREYLAEHMDGIIPEKKHKGKEDGKASIKQTNSLFEL